MAENEKPRFYVGIDPGVTGAVSVISVTIGSPVLKGAFPMPRREEHGRDIVDGAALAAQLRPLVEAGAVFAIEDVWARPGQGVTSMFGFGQSLGIVRGVLSGLGAEYRMVSAATWKRAIGVVGDKAAIWGVVSRIPGMPPARAKHLGVADAAGIALWLLRGA